MHAIIIGALVVLTPSVLAAIWMFWRAAPTDDDRYERKVRS
jgi:hypothetical protein